MKFGGMSCERRLGGEGGRGGGGGEERWERSVEMASGRKRIGG